MIDDPVWRLFGREVCPLCDEAAAVLDAAGLAWDECDIDHDVELLTRYRDKVPVVLHRPSGREFAWPFGLAELQAVMDDG